MRLHFVRHGQSTWNLEGRVQGQTRDVPLTATGRAQARAAADLLRGSSPRRLLTSDLLRAVQSAAPVARALGLSPVAEPALREQRLGSLEGRLARELEVATTSPGERVTSVRWGGGESVVDVHARVGRFLGRLLASSGEAGDDARDVVLVTHGDTIRIAVAWLRGVGPHDVEWFEVPNGSVTTVSYHAGTVTSVATAVPGLSAPAP